MAQCATPDRRTRPALRSRRRSLRVPNDSRAESEPGHRSVGVSWSLQTRASDVHTGAVYFAAEQISSQHRCAPVLLYHELQNQKLIECASPAGTPVPSFWRVSASARTSSDSSE